MTGSNGHSNGAHHRQIAGLMPPWKPGQSGNPRGRPSAGAAVKEWMNALEGKTRQELAEIVADESAPLSKVAAARRWISALTDPSKWMATKEGVVRIGDSAVPGQDFDRIMDRTEGKPESKTNTTVDGTVLIRFVDEHSVAKGRMHSVLDADE